MGSQPKILTKGVELMDDPRRAGVVILMVFMTALFFLSVDEIIRLVVGFILSLGR